MLAERFDNGDKITELAKLHSRTYGAIKLDSQTWVTTEIKKPNITVGLAVILYFSHATRVRQLWAKLETQQKCWASNLLYSQAQVIHYIAQHTKT